MIDFKISQLTKELVVARLKNMGDPCAAAAELVKKTLLVALKEHGLIENDFIKVIREACYGGMTGLVLAEQNLPHGAVCMLNAMSELAAELALDPTQVMRGCLEGIADLHRVLTLDQLEAIRREIKANLIGADEAFSAILGSILHTHASKPND